ncbi:MAG: hypothetical protein ABI182_08995 [Candidatus Baltobacteraceae bacterium]
MSYSSLRNIVIADGLGKQSFAERELARKSVCYHKMNAASAYAANVRPAALPLRVMNLARIIFITPDEILLDLMFLPP